MGSGERHTLEQKSDSAHSRGREKSLAFQIAPVLLLKCLSSAAQCFYNIEIVLVQKIASPTQKNEKVIRW